MSLRHLYKIFLSLFLVYYTSISPSMAASNPSLIPSVPTIADMVAKGPASPQYPVINVQNYRGTSGGGGGIFYWTPGSTDTTNICTVFAATGMSTGRWIRQLTDGNHLDVLDCGADSTGVLDSTAAFIAAQSISSTVSVPIGISGLYTLTTDSFILNSGGTLECEGSYNDVTIQSFSTTGSIITIGTGSALTTDVTVRNCQIGFDSSVARMSGQRGILLNWTARTHIDNNDILNASVNLFGQDSLLAYIDSNRIRSGTVGIIFQPGTNQDAANVINITNNFITSNTNQAIRMNDTGTNTFADILIASNDIEGNGTSGSGLDVVSLTNLGAIGSENGASVNNNHFEGNLGRSDVSLAVAGSSITVSARDNTFLSTGVSSANLTFSSGVVTSQGNAGSATGPSHNVEYGASTNGLGFPNLFGSTSNLGSVVTGLACGINSAVTC